MKKEYLKSYVKELLAKGDVQKAIAMLLEWSKPNNSGFYDNVVLLSGRYNKHKEKRHLGLESGHNLDVELNRINYALIESLKDLPEEAPARFGNIFIERETEDKPKDKSSFSFWLEHKKTRIGSLFVSIGLMGLVLGIIAIAIALLEYDSLEEEKGKFDWIAFIAIMANILVAGLAVVYVSTAKISDEISSKFNELLNGDGSSPLENYYERAQSATKEFIRFWRLVWIGWIVLYISFFFKFYHEDLSVFGIGTFLKDNFFKNDYEFFIQTWIDTWSNVSSFALIVCFSILYFKNSSRKDKHYDNPITNYSRAQLRSVPHSLTSL